MDETQGYPWPDREPLNLSVQATDVSDWVTEITPAWTLTPWHGYILSQLYGGENPVLVARVADALQARDKEHSGHEEPRDFYEDMAAVAIRAVREY